MIRKKTYLILTSTILILFGELTSCSKDDSDKFISIIIRVKTSHDLENIKYRIGGDTAVLPQNPSIPYDSIPKVGEGLYQQKVDNVKLRSGILINGEFQENATNSPSEAIFTIYNSKTLEVIKDGKIILQEPHDIFEFNYATEL